MPPEVDDVPTIKELFRTITDFREEWRADKAQMVRKDVHHVEHEALIARLGRLEADVAGKEKERATIRNQYYFSVVGAILSLVVALVVAVVK